MRPSQHHTNYVVQYYFFKIKNNNKKRVGPTIQLTWSNGDPTCWNPSRVGAWTVLANSEGKVTKVRQTFTLPVNPWFALHSRDHDNPSLNSTPKATDWTGFLFFLSLLFFASLSCTHPSIRRYPPLPHLPNYPYYLST